MFIVLRDCVFSLVQVLCINASKYQQSYNLKMIGGNKFSKMIPIIRKLSVYHIY